MSARVANVFLRDMLVGRLHEDDQGWVELRLTEEYRGMPLRPVLGQWFEDHPRARPRGARAGELPAYFENFLPEGDLKVLLHERLGVAHGDDLGLLCAIGDDLPGAVIVQLADGEAPTIGLRPPPSEQPEPGLRFSLAGVQLKFSLVRHGERFALPGRDSRGDWIVKIAFDAFPELARNEWLTMEWARAAGFAVPATELRPLRDLIDVPHEGDPNKAVFLIARYDRDGTARIHQEDFQQIVGRPAEGKYADTTYDALVSLATAVVGEAAYEEVLRRLAFVVASGNNDAHMKNWSVTDPAPGLTAQLSPLYDQVFTAQWPQFSQNLALKLGGTKLFADLDRRRFGELGRRVGKSPEQTMATVETAIAGFARAWQHLRATVDIPPAYSEALRHHWRRVPLLRPHADAV